MDNSASFLRLANRLYEIICSNQTCINNWGFYLFSPEFDNESELRNKIGTIWVCSLMDTLEAQEFELPKIRAEAAEQGWHSLADAADQLLNFCMLVSELVQQLTREEQIFLKDFRNQLVHSYLTARHKNQIRVKYYLTGSLQAETLSHASYHEICRSFYLVGVDAAVAPIIKKALNRELRYWKAVIVFQRDSALLYQCLRERKPFKILF